MNFCGRCFLTIRGRRSGPMATTSPATTGETSRRSTRASSTAPKCSRDRRRLNNVSSRRRRLPQQRGSGRQGDAASGAPNIMMTAGGLRAQEPARGRRGVCVEVLRHQGLPSILPPITFEEALETTKIHSVAGLTRAQGVLAERPFRAPHHTISDSGLIGGSSIPRPAR